MLVGSLLTIGLVLIYYKASFCMFDQYEKKTGIRHVSYTHLDVYKRQAMIRSVVSSDGVPAPKAVIKAFAEDVSH